MNFHYYNEDIERNYNEILKKIYLSKNGVTADTMLEMGMNYKKNMGVSIVRLREIASEYQHSHLLALKLWKNKQRETQIMAFLLDETDKLTTAVALKIAFGIDQTELAETGAMFLFSKMPDAYNFCVGCINSGKELTAMTGFYTAARIIQNFTGEQILYLLKLAFDNAETQNYHLGKSVGVFLGRICRKSKETAEKVQYETNKISENDSEIKRLIKDMVNQEINYFVHK